jgi:M6 family metalloprotease-like protein
MESTVSHSGKVKVSGYNINPGVWDVCGSQILCIGVVAHKTSHFLGLLDLYDPDGGGYGLGIHCLMADSWGADASKLYSPMMVCCCCICNINVLMILI